VHGLSEQTGAQSVKDFRDIYKLDRKAVLPDIETLRAIAHSIESQKEMNAVCVRRWIWIQAGKHLPAPRSKSGFFCKFPTSRMLQADVVRVDGPSR